MLPRVGIVSVIYEEPEWKHTKTCVEKCNVPTIYVDRGGTGSLAKAHNRGFKELLKQNPELDYVWFITNPTFTDDVFPELVAAMEHTGYNCIHPAFDSDHKHTQPDGSGEIKPVPFVEFTAPMVDVETFKKFPLDEQMPYWGHDFDFGYKVRNSGGVVAVHHGLYVKHVYIRNRVKVKPHIKTLLRRAKRKRTNSATHRRLEQVYGKNTWRDKLQYYGK